MTVIDGARQHHHYGERWEGYNPCAVAVNPVTNKIYVANSQSGTVTVIDGASINSTPAR